MKKSRILGLVLLCLMLMSVLLPASAEAKTPGSFYLYASSANHTLIEPVSVSYTTGQTVRDALIGSGYAFDGIEKTGGFITAIEGTAASYLICYDGGGYDLNVPADSISAILFTTETQSPETALPLLTRCGEYKEMSNNVQSYAPAQTAYTAALDGLRTADAAQDTLLAELNKAIGDYEAILSGPKTAVSFELTQGAGAPAKTEITLTDSYGNVTEGVGTQFSLVAGTYSYVISDGGWNRCEGTVTVADTALTVPVVLPSGEWYGSIEILGNDKEKTPFPITQPMDPATHSMHIAIPDVAVKGLNGRLYLKATQGPDIGGSNATLHACYIATDGDDNFGYRYGWNSETSQLTYFLEPDMTGRSMDLEAHFQTEAGYTQIQSYEVVCDRVPTLESLSLLANGSALDLAFNPLRTEYSVRTVEASLEIVAESFLAEGCTISYNGGSNPVFSLQDGKQDITVTVTHESGASQSYLFHVEKVPFVSVTLTLPAGTTGQVFSKGGAETLPTDGAYHLIAGESYCYVGTKNDYYHSRADFTAAEGLAVAVAEPDTADALLNLVLYNNRSAKTRAPYEATAPFASARHDYTYIVGDSFNAVCAQALPAEGYELHALYTSQDTMERNHGLPKDIKITAAISETGTATFLSSCAARCGYGQELTLRLQRSADTVSYYQDYELYLRRDLTLNSLKISENGADVLMLDSLGRKTGFNREILDYYLPFDHIAESLTLNGTLTNTQSTTPICGGYTVEINGRSYSALEDVVIPLTGSPEDQTITLTVKHLDPRSVSRTYTLHCQQKDPVIVSFNTTPANAIVSVVYSGDGKAAPKSSEGFALMPGAQYDYTVSCYGYVAEKVTGYVAPGTDSEIAVTLTPAPASEPLPQLNAPWPNWRADEFNNGVISFPTPIDSDKTVLTWATKMGTGWGNAPSCPILVDDSIYIYYNKYIAKLDSFTGEVQLQGEMTRASSFAINSPAYAEGMIFVALANGGVQAFNATTLESLWVYNDPLQGQPNCPIVYHNGYVYTGFWGSETRDANFVCLSVTDEEPGNPLEEKAASWTYTAKGGFYWAGAYASDNYVLIGTDDGSSGSDSGYGRLVSLDPGSGSVIDIMTMPMPGDIRSSITKNPQSNEFYFTTKGGEFYGVTVDAAGKLSNLRYMNLAQQAGDSVMSTSTPTVYNNRAYVGVSGPGGNFGPGNSIAVLDLLNWEPVYWVPTDGYVQTSSILTTAYDSGDGTVYIYNIGNKTPGIVCLIEDKPGQTAPSKTTLKDGTEIAYSLFTPTGSQAQYAICSPIADANGNLYFKNDSCYVMCLSSTVDHLSIDTPPAKTSYKAGELFDPSGIKVTAHYANGSTRDVTKYISYSAEPLTPEDSSFSIGFEKFMYQDKDGKAGVPYVAPAATLTLEIKTALKGDLNGDGEITSRDALMLYAHLSGSSLLSGDALLAADMNDDGEITSRDALMLYFQLTQISVPDKPVE